MGSSKTPKPGASPGTVHPGPDQIGDEGDAGPATLTIRLINIREAVHRETQIGEEVLAAAGTRPLLAAVAAGTLGEVPPQHVASVENLGYRSGSVVSLGNHPLSATVTLSRM